MSIVPLASLSAVQSAVEVGMSAPSTHAGSGSSSGANSFASTLAGAVDDVQGLQATSKQLAISAVTGDLTDIHQTTIAATRAQVTLEVVAAVRDKGIAAFNEIMRMQA